MNLLYLFVFSTLCSNNLSSLLTTKKICKDCKHVIGDNIECIKFGDVNLVTEKVRYHSAKSIIDCLLEAKILFHSNFLLFLQNY